MTSNNEKRIMTANQGEIKSTYELIKNEKIRSFNPPSHHPPRYDLFGRLKPFYKNPNNDNCNILKYNPKLPEWWGELNKSKEEKRTKTTLEKERKAQKIPDPTFDIDGDGYVGFRDFFLSSHFDKDRDGKLNEKEKKEAIESIKNGFENNFVWGLEQTGNNPKHRYIQTRGKIIHAEDFRPITSTYPPHPISEIKPKSETQQIMFDQRKLDNLKANNAIKYAWDKVNPASIPQEFKVSEFLVEKPKHASMQEIEEENRIKARNDANLGPQNQGKIMKIQCEDPTTKYVENPQYKTRTEWKQGLKKANCLQIIGSSMFSHVGPDERLNMRESGILRLGHKDEEGRTQKKLKEERKKEMIEYNNKIFAKIPSSIHGKELPLFATSQRDFWASGKPPKPLNTSQKELKEKQKFWAKPDMFLISSYKDKEAPEDPFKSFKKLRIFKNHVADKVTSIDLSNKVPNINPIENDNGGIPGSLGKQKWTDKEFKEFLNQKCVYEEDPNLRESLLRSENEALFSSFSKDHKFKELLKTQKFLPKANLDSTSKENKIKQNSFKNSKPSKKEHLQPSLLLKMSKENLEINEKCKSHLNLLAVRTGGF